MDFTSLLPFAGALLGGASSGNSQQTQSRDPWGPAQGWLSSNLGLGQNLQSQYMANPLSPYQMQGYANSASLSNTGRANAGNLIKQMNSTQFFDRSNPLSRPTPFQYVGGDTSQSSGSSGGGFAPVTNLGFTVNPVAAAPTQQAQQAMGTGVSTVRNYGGGNGLSRSEGGLAGNGTNFTDAQWATVKDMNDAYGMWNNPVTQASLGGFADLFSGNYKNALKAQQNAVDAINAFKAMKAGPDESAAETARLAAKQQAAYESAKAAAEASPGGFYGGSASAMSGGGAGSSGEGTSAATGGSDGDASGGGDRGTRGGFAKGGLVKKSNLSGPNPKGPDEGRANLQSGEYVIKKSAVDKYGKGLLDEINSKRFTKKQGK